MPETEVVEYDRYRIRLEFERGGWYWEVRLWEPLRHAFLQEVPGVWSYVASHWAYTRWGALYAAKKAARKRTEKHLQPKQKVEEVSLFLSRTPHPKERP